MTSYIIRRVGQFVLVFFAATFLIFAMVFAIPGDPIRALAGEKPMPDSLRQTLVQQFHLDEPFLAQYWHYMTGVIQGDLGTSFNDRPVADIIKEAFPKTLRLAIYAFIIEMVIGVTAGVWAGIRKDKFLDSLVKVSTVAVISVPIFVLGFMAQLLIGVRLGWLPVTAGNPPSLYGYLLPAMVLAAVSLAYVARLTRSSVVENLRSDYVRTAKAKGLSQRRVIGVHTFRNSLIPVVTFLAIDLGALMGGAIVTETIFNIPGIGRAVYQATLSQEGAVVVGIVTVLVIIYAVANLVVDIMYAVLDPRIRYD
ncbi:MAG TPA: ABC transporter permease [Acidimicrobiia bacterium]|nr:ABC transporter permease [Acidimicrobiia bacterium]